MPLRAELQPVVVIDDDGIDSNAPLGGAISIERFECHFVSTTQASCTCAEVCMVL